MEEITLSEPLKQKSELIIQDLHFASYRKYPNWFWRLTQYLILGIKWEEIK
jgi:hypothetical protein